MNVRVTVHLAGGRLPGADEFTCPLDDVPARLRPTLAQLPAETVGRVRYGLTAVMPEALRTSGEWQWSGGPILVTVTVCC